MNGALGDTELTIYTHQADTNRANKHPVRDQIFMLLQLLEDFHHFRDNKPSKTNFNLYTFQRDCS
jgi:hypothetical protein